jgi:cytochrome c oxidase subunit 2
MASDWQSVLDPAGPAAANLRGLFWLFVGVCGAIWLLVMGVTIVAVLRRHRTAPPGSERRAGITVGVALALTVMIITGFTLLSYAATRTIATPDPNAVVIQVRGYQWWWQVTYPDNQQPSHSFITANEIHIPVGKTVRIELSAEDVIHSFWIPNLGGKQDLIPGRENTLTLRADQPGIYRGQCAQFCGVQHAHMAILVIAEPQAEFDAWRTAQVAAPQSPRTDEEKRGLQILTSQACGSCHTVRGTAAAGTLGPDLTHVANRRTIAAGMLLTTRGALAAWIADPQTIKPGNNMPLVPLAPDELQAVSAYLAGLK